jgi:N-acetylmuramoyl-L-alanine amidase
MRWIEAAAALGMAAVAAGLEQSPAAQAPPAVQMPQSPGMPALPAPVIPQPVQPPPFVVVVDAAHGGSDTGRG